MSTWGAGEQASNAALRDGTVLKTPGPWVPSVIALLQHFEQTGFAGAPRVVGDGLAADGRLHLTYLPGITIHPRAWPIKACVAIGALLREAHDAAASFAAPEAQLWSSSWLRDIGDHDDLVTGHGDAAPWNIVGPGGAPSGLIDWDSAGPIDRLTEVAYAVWLNAQLHDDDIAQLQGLPPATERADLARAIVDGYQLSRQLRAMVVDRMIEIALASVRADAVEHDVTPDSTAAVSPSGYPVLWSVVWRARSAGWMFRHRQLLTNALTADACPR